LHFPIPLTAKSSGAEGVPRLGVVAPDNYLSSIRSKGIFPL
jgi:hypothetical protein